MIFQSTHQLELRIIAATEHELGGFQIGTCSGGWGKWEKGQKVNGTFLSEPVYFINDICNDVRGNGHFTDCMEWFEYLCKSEKRSLMFLDVKILLRKHLMEKRGFIEWVGSAHLIKQYPF